MTLELRDLIALAGAGQLCLLAAAALVPSQLDWRSTFVSLPRLHRQMYWTYGGYVLMAIAANGLISMLNATELAAGSPLARSFCGYVALFWGVRLILQAIFDASPYLTTWWLKLGYRTLTVLFAAFTLIFGWAALAPST